MNPSPETPDPLLQSLAAEAADLPGLAAREARRARAARQQRRRVATAALALCIAGFGTWRVIAPVHPDPAPTTAQVNPAEDIAPPAVAPESDEYIKVQTVQEALTEPLPMPAGLSKEQQDVVTAARGLPLLLVKDASGKVTRIHAIEQ